MNDQERLEQRADEIKNDRIEIMEVLQNADYLSERFEKLEQEKQELERHREADNKVIEILEQQNKRYEETFEDIIRMSKEVDEDYECEHDANDFRKVARQALQNK